MLTTLCIDQFAIVQHLELDFSQGMTTFTGETGAGKSIMIDALMLALGERADVSVIRPGKDKCSITAGFYVSPESVPAQWLIDQDIPFADGEIFLRRVIYAEGRSKSYINGQPYPLQKVKELSEKLVHIHGQHQNQTLMHHATHREQLDRYAKHDILLNEVARLFKQVQKVQQEINHAKKQSLSKEHQTLLQFQIDEIAALNLQDNELRELHDEHQLLHHAKDYLNSCQQIDSLLNADEGPDICSSLNHVLQITAHLPQDQVHVQTIQELINAALIQCEEATNELKVFAGKIQLDPERLQQIELRMSAIHQLARKYHIDSQKINDHLQQLQQQLNQLEANEKNLSTLEASLQKTQLEYQQAAHHLTESRKNQALKLAEEITLSIQKLGMPKGWIEIEMSTLDKMSAHGMDRVEYKICTNPGMQADFLSKIASGGELSRVGLAIQMITAQKGCTPTLLFDEVDVGIGGSTAALVGQMLRQLGNRLQVFCVTHQPQVAAAAHHHFVVEKQSDAQQTFTRIIHLTESQKVDEIARMLGGLKITEQTLSHAQELLFNSN